MRPGFVRCHLIFFFFEIEEITTEEKDDDSRLDELKGNLNVVQTDIRSLNETIENLSQQISLLLDGKDPDTWIFL